jgi:hypothetical protein
MEIAEPGEIFNKFRGYLAVFVTTRPWPPCAARKRAAPSKSLVFRQPVHAWNQDGVSEWELELGD